MKCLLCNKEFAQITGKHLLAAHNIGTIEEYKKMFPNAETYRERKDTPETLEKKRIARTGKKYTQEAKNKIGAKHKGKKRSEEEIDKWRVSYRKFLDEHGSPMLGKDRGEAFSKKMSEIAKNRPKELVDAKVEMMLAARRGSKATPEQRENYSKGRLKFMTENPDKLGKVLFNTKPELEFEKVLQLFEINYRKSVRLPKYLYDFCINDNILIEIDGPYHWNKNMYGDKNCPDEIKLEGLNKTIQKDQLKT